MNVAFSMNHRGSWDISGVSCETQKGCRVQMYVVFKTAPPFFNSGEYPACDDRCAPLSQIHGITAVFWLRHHRDSRDIWTNPCVAERWWERMLQGLFGSREFFPRRRIRSFVLPGHLNHRGDSSGDFPVKGPYATHPRVDQSPAQLWAHWIWEYFRTYEIVIFKWEKYTLFRNSLSRPPWKEFTCFNPHTPTPFAR